MKPILFLAAQIWLAGSLAALPEPHWITPVSMFIYGGVLSLLALHCRQ
jgi:uncharacterized protein involved in response to NO